LFLCIIVVIINIIIIIIIHKTSCCRVSLQCLKTVQNGSFFFTVLPLFVLPDYKKVCGLTDRAVFFWNGRLTVMLGLGLNA